VLEMLEVLLASRNVDVVWMGGCEWITPPMASRETYVELVQESEAEIIRHIHAAGALSQIHCHGNIRSTLELIIERGADYTEPVEPPPQGDITFAEAKRIAGSRMTLGGNIEASLLANGSASQVSSAVAKAFEGGSHRMVLMPSAYPIGEFTATMARNYNALIDSWEKLTA
jgi:uroporphyrinogen-III decarboxylase